MTGVFNVEAEARVSAEYGSGTALAYVSHKLHLATADPGTGSPANEVTGGSYASQTIAFGTATVGSPSGGQVANTGGVTYAGMPATTSTHGWIDGTTAAPATNPQISFALSSPVTTSAGQSVSFAVGAVTVKQA